MISFTFKNRIILQSALLMGIALLTVILAIANLHVQLEASKETGESWIPIISNSAELSINIANFRRLEINFLSTQSIDERALILDSLDATTANIQIYSGAIAPLLTSPYLKSKFNDFRTNWEKYNDVSKNFRVTVDKNNTLLAESLLQGEALTLYDNATISLKNLTDHSYLAGIEISKQITARFHRAVLLIAMISSLGILTGLLFSILNIHYLKNKLEKISKLIKRSTHIIFENISRLHSSSQVISTKTATTAAAFESVLKHLAEISEKNRIISIKSEKALVISSKNSEVTSCALLKIANLRELLMENRQLCSKVEELTKETSNKNDQAIQNFVCQIFVRCEDALSQLDESLNVLKCSAAFHSQCNNQLQKFNFICQEQSRRIEAHNKSMGFIDQGLRDVTNSMTLIKISTTSISQEFNMLQEIILQLYLLIGKELGESKENSSNNRQPKKEFS